MSAVAAKTVYVPPPDQLATVLAKAGEFGLPPAKRGRYELIVRVLWNHFMHGVHSHPGVTVPEANRILVHAFTYQSGVALITNVDRFDGFGSDGQTSYCAYVCGHYAHAGANSTVAKQVTQPIYERAWDRTKADFDAKFAALLKLSGKTKDPDLGYACN